MQETLTPCFVKELNEIRLCLEKDKSDEENLSKIDICGMTELVAGYMDCMQEAVNYLKAVEQYSDNHPTIIGLTSHLNNYRRQLLIGETFRIDSNSQSTRKSHN